MENCFSYLGAPEQWVLLAPYSASSRWLIWPDCVLVCFKGHHSLKAFRDTFIIYIKGEKLNISSSLIVARMKLLKGFLRKQETTWVLMLQYLLQRHCVVTILLHFQCSWQVKHGTYTISVHQTDYQGSEDVHSICVVGDNNNSSSGRVKIYTSAPESLEIASRTQHP